MKPPRALFQHSAVSIFSSAKTSAVTQGSVEETLSRKFCPSRSPFLGICLSLTLVLVPSAICQGALVEKGSGWQNGPSCTFQGAYSACPSAVLFDSHHHMWHHCWRVCVACNQEENLKHAHRCRQLCEDATLASVEVWGCKGGFSGVFCSDGG